MQIIKKTAKNIEDTLVGAGKGYIDSWKNPTAWTYKKVSKVYNIIIPSIIRSNLEKITLYTSRKIKNSETTKKIAKTKPARNLRAMSYKIKRKAEEKYTELKNKAETRYKNSKTFHWSSKHSLMAFYIISAITISTCINKKYDLDTKIYNQIKNSNIYEIIKQYKILDKK